MDEMEKKLWFSYQSWYERDAPIRGAILRSIAAVFRVMRDAMRKTARQRYYLEAEPPQTIGRCVQEQLRNPWWRIQHVEDNVPQRVYTIYRASSGEIGLAYKRSDGATVLLQRVIYSAPGTFAPGLYRIAADTSTNKTKIWVAIGQAPVSASESFVITNSRSIDYLKLAIDETGWKTTQSTDPTKIPAGWADIKNRALAFIGGQRSSRTALMGAVRMVDPIGNVTQFREDWTSRIYGNFCYIGHFWRKVSPRDNPVRSYWTSIWKTKSIEACRAIIVVHEGLVNSDEIKLIAEQYADAGIFIDVRARQGGGL